MNIFNTLKGIVGAITLAVLSLFGTGATPYAPQIANIASTTDAVVQQTINEATTTTKDDVAQAYELGKSVGRLQEKVESLSTVPKTIVNPIVNPNPMQENTNQTPSVTAGAPSQPAPSVTAPSSIPAPTSAPVETPTQTAPVSLAHIDIIYPTKLDGYIANNYKLNPDGTLAEGSTEPIDSNSVVLKAVVYGDDGKPMDNTIVFITATDQAQNKTEKGTGDVMNIWVNGDRRQVPVYSFHYEFKTPGDHKVVFTANGMFQEVTLIVK